MRWQFRYALLTYSDARGLDPFKIVDVLAGLKGECIVAEETHENGEPHFHAFVEFRPKFRSSNPRVFDVDGFHPNVSPTKTKPWSGWDYATKYGEIVAGGLERPKERTVADRRDEYRRVLDATTPGEYREALREVDPRALYTSYNSVKAYEADTFAGDPNAYEVPEGYSFSIDHVEGLADWVEQYLRGHTAGGK